MSTGQAKQQKVLVAMPAYNEEKYIGSLVLQARQYADEVLVVDDGSTDRTVRIAKLAGATVIKHGENRGYGATIQKILTEAKKNAPDVLVLMDADAQHDPEEIAVFIKAIRDGHDLAVGYRNIDRKEIPSHRKIGQKVLTYFTRLLSRSRLSDTECGFRAFSRKAIETLEPREKGMAISAETVSEAARKGLKITEVPVSAIYTGDGSTLNPVRHGVGVLNRILVMISERRPLLFFGLLGSVLIILGVVAGVMVVKLLFASQMLHVGTALVSMLLITIGMLSIFAGIILNVMVKRIKESGLTDNSK
jgi:glycosyltransferase involved in cell wall biosynthesis